MCLHHSLDGVEEAIFYNNFLFTELLIISIWVLNTVSLLRQGLEKLSDNAKGLYIHSMSTVRGNWHVNNNR